MVHASLNLDRARQRGISAIEYKGLEAAAAELARTEATLQADADEAHLELSRAWGKAAFSPKQAAKRRLAARKKAIEHSKGPLDIAALAAVRAPEGPADPGPARGTPYPLRSTGRRSALARWLVDRKNPLTARVAVNHVWMRHMNRPLVESVADFGLRSPSPPEKELLDWLANDLMDHGWNLKRLDRLIVTSRAYRRSSDGNQADAATRQADPEGDYFWKYPATRLEAEEIRDGIFYIAGALDERVGGPTISPKQELTPRRSLYFTQSMDDHERFLSTFDAADVLQCYRREVSVLPQQALALANSHVTLQMAAQIAARLERRHAGRRRCQTNPGPDRIGLPLDPHPRTDHRRDVGLRGVLESRENACARQSKPRSADSFITHRGPVEPQRFCHSEVGNRTTAVR